MSSVTHEYIAIRCTHEPLKAAQVTPPFVSVQVPVSIVAGTIRLLESGSNPHILEYFMSVLTLDDS